MGSETKSGIANILKKYIEKEIIVESSKKELEKDLENFYENGKYRHSYSEISKLILELYKNDNKNNFSNKNENKIHCEFTKKISEFTKKINDILLGDETVANSELKNEKSYSEQINYLVASLKEIVRNNDSIKNNINKLIDHLELEQLRLEYIGNEFANFNNKIEKTEEDFFKRVEENKKILEEKTEEVENNLSNTKFDLIALTTLVFSAFTVIGTNVSIVTGILSSKITLDFSKFLMALLGGNIIIVLSIYLIYLIIRRIHGKLKPFWFYVNLVILALFYIAIFIIIANYDKVIILISDLLPFLK